MNGELQRMQLAVREAGLDAWLLYDFRGSNFLAWSMLNLPADTHSTRRWIVCIPSHGEPTKIVHRMEQYPLANIKAKQLIYDTHESWAEAVLSVASYGMTVAMEYSPMGALPVVSTVDAGTIELVRAGGAKVVSSADLLQQFTAVLSEEQIGTTSVTAGQLKASMMDAFRYVREHVLDDGEVSEYDVQQYLVKSLEGKGLAMDHAPIVAIGRNAANPHYFPSFADTSMIEKNMVVLIDAWAKANSPGAVYADLTMVGYTGVTVPTDVDASFKVIASARDAAIDLVKTRFASDTPVMGYEIDRVCRNVVENAGLGDAFIHRTGHNIHTEVHGPGANIDDFETHDTRKIARGTTFSIEPGVYFPSNLGLRTEIDVMIGHDGMVTIPSEPMQHSILPLLSDAWLG
ncbi:MAG: M24 family metallopeptidase [bacterium]|nr:M24 family metallopeptidase [bacterium]